MGGSRTSLDFKGASGSGNGAQKSGVKPFNRLVPVPPPKDFMMGGGEEEKKQPIRPQKKVMISGQKPGNRGSAATTMGYN